MTPCKELAGISHDYISTFNPCTEVLNYRDRQGRCEREEVGEDIIAAVWQFRGRQKRWKIASDVPCGKTNSCCCWPQRNSWRETENSRRVSHGHSWPVILIVWMTLEFKLLGTATDVCKLFSLRLFYKSSDFTVHQQLFLGSSAPERQL